MAILSAVPPPSQQDPNIPLTAFALSQLSIGGTTLRIPLDEPVKRVGVSGAYGGKKRAEIQRDSMKSREALLKGKEGSRRRRRWETGTLSFYLLDLVCGDGKEGFRGKGGAGCG